MAEISDEQLDGAEVVATPATERITDEERCNIWLHKARDLGCQNRLESSRDLVRACDYALKARADFERCSDHAATLGIENEALRARVEELESEGKKLVAYNTKHFNRVRELERAKPEVSAVENRERWMKHWHTKYNALRARVRELEIEIGKVLTWREHWYDEYHTLRDAVRDAAKAGYSAEALLKVIDKSEGGGESRGNTERAIEPGKDGMSEPSRPALDCPTCGDKTWDWVNGREPCPTCGKEPKDRQKKGEPDDHKDV